MRVWNAWFPEIAAVFVAAATMGMWTNERANGTQELLFTLPARDIAGVARSLGLESVAAGSIDDFRAALSGFANDPAPVVVDCRFDPDGYMQIADPLR